MILTAENHGIDFAGRIWKLVCLHHGIVGSCFSCEQLAPKFSEIEAYESWKRRIKDLEKIVADCRAHSTAQVEIELDSKSNLFYLLSWVEVYNEQACSGTFVVVCFVNDVGVRKF